jgi:hypothetical protein
MKIISRASLKWGLHYDCKPTVTKQAVTTDAIALARGGCFSRACASASAPF